MWAIVIVFEIKCTSLYMEKVLYYFLLQLCHIVNHNLSYKIVEKKNCDKRCSPKISLTLVNTNRQYKN